MVKKKMFKSNVKNKKSILLVLWSFDAKIEIKMEIGLIDQPYLSPNVSTLGGSFRFTYLLGKNDKKCSHIWLTNQGREEMRQK